MNAANTHASNEEDTQLLNDLYAGYDDNVDEHAALLDPGYTTYDNHQSETDTNTPNPPRLSGTTAFRLVNVEVWRTVIMLISNVSHSQIPQQILVKL